MYAQEMRIQIAKRSDMGNAVMKGLRFAHTQELCFEAWKRSSIACSALLCDRFTDSQKSRFFRLGNVQICGVLSWKLVVLLIITNSVFMLENVQIWSVSMCNWVYSLIVRNGIYRLRNVQIKAEKSSMRVDLLMHRNSVFTVRNVEVWAVLSSNEGDLLMFRNRVFRLRIDQK